MGTRGFTTQKLIKEHGAWLVEHGHYFTLVGERTAQEGLSQPCLFTPRQITTKFEDDSLQQVSRKSVVST